MISINKAMLLIFMSALVSACASYDKKTAAPSISKLTVCNEPRPQLCTREYNPVCATYKDGSKKTGATGCTACSDTDVVGYVMAACATAAVD